MNFDDRDGVIWFDGKMVPWRDARVHVLTHTLHYGLGVFEGVRAYHTDKRGTCIFRLREHTERLFRSAHILRMNMPFDKDTVSEAQRAVIRENGLEEGYLRPMCFLGSEGMGLRAEGLQTHVIVALTGIATVRRKKVALALRFDTFGDHLQTQALPQRNDGAGNGCIVRIGQNLPHEGLVDLELVQRQPAQITQR